MAGAPSEGAALAPAQPEYSDPQDTPAITERGSLGACGLAVSIYADVVPAGMLPCAYMFARTGEWSGTILLVCFGMAHVFFSYMLIRAMEAGNQNTLGNLIIYVTGIEFAWLPLVVVLIAASGCCIGYLSLILDMMPEVFPIATDAVPFDTKLLYLIPPLCVILPSCLCRNFSGLLTTSILAAVCAMCTVVVVIIRAAQSSYDDGHQAGIPVQHTSIQYALQPVVILTAAMFCHYNTCRYYRELCDRKLSSFALISGSAILAAVATFVVFAWTVHRSLGFAVKYTALSGYGTHDPLAISARLLSCASIFGSFPLAFGGARAAGIDLCRLCRHPRCVAPCFIPQVCLDKLEQIEATMSITLRDLLAPVMLVSMVAVSILCTDLHNLVSILNATSSSVVFFAFPPMLFMAVAPKRSTFQKGASESLLALVGLLCGLLAVGACLYATLVPKELAI